jgi:DNA polymerase-1
VTEPERHLELVRTGPLDHARAHLIQTTDDAAELLRWLSTKKKIAFDTETTGLDHDLDRPRMVQVGDGRDGWAIPFERWAGLVDDIVRRFEGEYIMHNAPFDWIMAQHGGVDIPTHRIHDTRLMAHVLHSTGPLGLKELAQRYVDPRAAAAQQALNDGIGSHGGWTWANVPVTYEPYWVYGALDPVLTYLLEEQLRPQVEATAPNSYELELRVSWVCERMARKGARVDRDYTERFMHQLMAHVKEIEAWCDEFYGGVKPGSDEAIIDILLRDGVQLFKRTAGGRYSIDKEVLGDLNHPLAQAVLSRRQAQKLVSTYLRHYLDDSQMDGRIHPNINVVGGAAKNPFEQGGTRGVRTGRMSMDKPNLQNVPIHTAVAKKIRNCFVADEGHKWIKCDFDQIEMRIFAHLAGDDALTAAFYSDVDMFTASTRDIFGDPSIARSDERRQKVKNSFYAKLYGAGVEQFARTANIRRSDGDLDVPTAQAFLTRLDQMYPGIRRLQQQIEQQGYMRRENEGEAYVRSPFTQRKHVADAGREYALMNYMIQGAAGELLKMKMLECDAAGLGKYMILPVHDEIDLDVPEDELDDVKATLSDIMNDATLLSVPVTASMGVGDRWGEVE